MCRVRCAPPSRISLDSRLDFPGARGKLYCEGVSLEDIAARVGTPSYVYSGASITGAFRTLDGALGRLPHTLCYAVKANGNLSILRLLAALGSGFDIVSGGELYRLERAGVSGDRVVFSGVGKSREEIREALRAGIRLFNVESEAELELLAAEAARMGRPRARSHPRQSRRGRRRPPAHLHRPPQPQIWH